MSEAGQFWEHVRQLVAGSAIHIDRPRGSPHPRYPEIIYPLDYGYLENTTTVDGGGIDVWVGSGPRQEVTGLVCTLDLFKRDAEIKILLGCSPDETRLILDFLNGGPMRAMLIQLPLALIQSRRSIRRFQPTAVPTEVLRQVVESAIRAPSAHNSQPWRFAVLTGPGAKQQLAEQMGAAFRRDLLADGLAIEDAQAQVDRSRARIQQAPAVIVICIDREVGDHYPDPKRQGAEFLMAVQGAAMAGENLLLAAHALRLGGVWVCAPLFAPEVVRQALDLPSTWQAQGMILLGYPAKPPVERDRRPLEEVVLFR